MASMSIEAWWQAQPLAPNIVSDMCLILSLLNSPSVVTESFLIADCSAEAIRVTKSRQKHFASQFSPSQLLSSRLSSSFFPQKSSKLPSEFPLLRSRRVFVSLWPLLCLKSVCVFAGAVTIETVGELSPIFVSSDLPSSVCLQTTHLKDRFLSKHIILNW